MAKCDVCGKKPMSGHNVSFSEKKTKRQFKPNIQKRLVFENGRMTRKHICTRCLRTAVKTS